MTYFVFLNISPMGGLLGCQVLIFALIKLQFKSICNLNFEL